MTSVEWQPPEPRRRAARRHLLWVAAPLVAVFDVASVIELLRSDISGPGELIVALLITGPIIGAMLVLAPAVILANFVRSKPWIVAAAAVGGRAIGRSS